MTANALTLSRLFLALAYFVLLLVLPPGPLFFIPLTLLILAGLTDVFDGLVARRTGTVSGFGRVADAYIDRVLAIGAFVIFLHLRLVAVWVVLVLVLRELLTAGMRNLADSRGLTFQANVFGKTKFLSQFVACLAVTLYLAAFTGSPPARTAMYVFVYIAALNTIISGVAYLANYRKLVGVEKP